MLSIGGHSMSCRVIAGDYLPPVGMGGRCDAPAGLFALRPATRPESAGTASPGSTDTSNQPETEAGPCMPWSCAPRHPRMPRRTSYPPRNGVPKNPNLWVLGPVHPGSVFDQSKPRPERTSPCQRGTPSQRRGDRGPCTSGTNIRKLRTDVRLCVHYQRLRT